MTVQTLRARLTRDDIQRLSSATDSEGRALAARKFCARFASVDLSDDERAIGAEVVRLLAEDAAEMVRRSLSVTLQRSTHLPRMSRASSPRMWIPSPCRSSPDLRF